MRRPLRAWLLALTFCALAAPALAAGMLGVVAALPGAGPSPAALFIEDSMRVEVISIIIAPDWFCRPWAASAMSSRSAVSSFWSSLGLSMSRISAATSDFMTSCARFWPDWPAMPVMLIEEDDDMDAASVCRPAAPAVGPVVLVTF